MHSEETNAMTSRSSLRWQLHSQNVAVLWMDDPGDALNTLKESSADEFERVLDELEHDSAVAAVVFMSGKQHSFVAGADVSLFERVRSADQLTRLSRRAQAVMNRIAHFPKPFVAAIHGACLGGGFELALACHVRIASDDERTRFGLPEVQLGLLPGAGGTQRLPALIGVTPALDLMLTGRQLSAAQAKQLTIVDALVAVDQLALVAVARANALAKRAPAHRAVRRSFKRIAERRLWTSPWRSRLMSFQVRRRVLRQTKGNYPAPLEILEVVRRGLEAGFDAGLSAEARAFGALATTPQARELLHVFRAHQEVKTSSAHWSMRAAPRPLDRMFVIGGGVMGAGIAALTAREGSLPVSIQGRNAQRTESAAGEVRAAVRESVRRKRCSEADAARALARIEAPPAYTALSESSLVIEAIEEDLEKKRSVLRELERRAPRSFIFASTTSSLRIADIAAASVRPERVIGMHYFSPVERMQLLEVVITNRTADWVTATCVELGRRQDKTVIVVQDGPGFFTTRILAPFVNEALFMLEEGVPIERIDAALAQFGFPAGPFESLDRIGIDVAIDVNQRMELAFGARMPSPRSVERLRRDDRRGRKNGRGFYRMDDPKRVDSSVYEVLGVRPTPRRARSDELLALRPVLRLVNEAAFCFGEGILSSARDGDVGAIFGLGFPPFRGGPFRFIDALGAGAIVTQLERFARIHGPRFTPAPLLVEAAERGLSFYGPRQVHPGASARLPNHTVMPKLRRLGAAPMPATL
jgi:3-hydroxyacyl-CoA dehydrogenase/enoyl-CoA hydratase/3-hydroxybutyryl-CoA epimerase